MTNKIKKHKKSKIIFIIPVILLISFVYLGLSGRINLLNKSQDNAQTTNQNFPENVNKVDYSPPKPEDTVISPEKTNTAPKAEEATAQSAPISVLITRASREDVGVYIEKISEGTCELKVTQKGLEKIYMTAKIIAQSEYSSCEGFSIDSSKLDNTAFKVTVSVSSGDRLGSASQEVN